MAAFKHYSFDLWLTLIKSNPAFKQERIAFFHKHLNTMQKTQDEIAVVFRQVDQMCNAINEKTGGNMDSREMYLMVISMINDFHISYQDIDIDWIEKEMEQLFFTYAPVIFCADTKDTLERIRDKDMNTLNILSNTAFIQGAMLRKLLDELQLSTYFDFQLYSDEAGMSKPSRKFFQLLLDRIAQHKRHPVVGPEDIIHVGDNIHADLYGARQAGISSFQVNSNNISITQLLNAC